MIGELARLFNISTDTLRHYDKIDLLKPDFNEKTDYRYYSIRNFFKLSRILFFKSIDISLEDIKKYMKNKNRDNLLSMLKKKEEEIDIKINSLINLRNKLHAKHELLDSINNELDQIKIKRIPGRRGVFLDMSEVKSDSDFVQALKNNEKYLKVSSWLIEGQIYTSLSKENMEKGILNKFNYFIEILNLDHEPHEQIRVIPESEYACIAFLGPYKEMGRHYEILIRWIHENGYRIDGDSIEKNIVDYGFSDSENEYISEIQIPINRRQTHHKLRSGD